MPRALGTRAAFGGTLPEARSRHSLSPTRLCAGTHAWWPRPGLLTQDSAVPGVPGGLAEGEPVTRVASRAAVPTVRRKAASSRGRALTREVCSRSVAARVRRPRRRGARAREGLAPSFGTAPPHHSSAPRRDGRVRLKSVAGLRPPPSPSATASHACGLQSRPNPPVPRPPPGRQGGPQTPAHAALCTCPWASALSRPRSSAGARPGFLIPLTG